MTAPHATPAAAVARVEDPRLLTGHGTFVDDVAVPGMLHAASCAARSPGRAIGAVDTSAALALPGVHAVFTAADLNPRRARAVVHVDRARRAPRRPDRRWPRARSASSATRWRWSSPRAATSPRTPPSWWSSTTTRSPAVVDYRHGRAASDPRPRGPRLQPGRRDRRPARRPRSTRCSPARPTSCARRSRSRRTPPVPMEGRGIVVEWSAASGELTIWSATQSPHEVRLVLRPAARHPRAPHPRRHARHRGRVRPEGRGPARGDVPDARRPQGAGAGEVGRGPAREPAGRRASRARSTATCAMAFDDDGTIRRVGIDHVQDVGAYPTPWPVGTRPRSGCCSPGPTGCRPPTLRAPRWCYTNTVGRTAYRGPWQFESLAREVLLDIAGPPHRASTRSSCAGATCCAPTSCRTRTPTACPTTASRRPRRSSRRSACSTTTRSARAGRGPRRRAATSASARRTYVEPTTPGMGYYAHRGRDDPHRAVGHGERVRRRRLDRQQPRDDGRAAHGRRARRRHRRRRTRSRATPRSPPSAPAPRAAAAAR